MQEGPKKKQIDYAETIKAEDEDETTAAFPLVKKALEFHVNRHERTVPPSQIRWHEQRETFLPSWDISGRNVAVVQITVAGRTITSDAFESAADADDRSQDPRFHSERKALADAINKAIDQGWKPKNKFGKNLSRIKNVNAPTVEELLAYKEALASTTKIKIFTEREPCSPLWNTPKTVTTCTPLFNEILSPNAKIYFASPWKEGESKDAKQKVKDAVWALHFQNETQARYMQNNINDARVKKLIGDVINGYIKKHTQGNDKAKAQLNNIIKYLDEKGIKASECLNLEQQQALNEILNEKDLVKTAQPQKPALYLHKKEPQEGKSKKDPLHIPLKKEEFSQQSKKILREKSTPKLQERHKKEAQNKTRESSSAEVEEQEFEIQPRMMSFTPGFTSFTQAKTKESPKAKHGSNPFFEMPSSTRIPQTPVALSPTVPKLVEPRQSASGGRQEKKRALPSINPVQSKTTLSQREGSSHKSMPPSSSESRQLEKIQWPEKRIESTSTHIFDPPTTPAAKTELTKNQKRRLKKKEREKKKKAEQNIQREVSSLREDETDKSMEGLEVSLKRKRAKHKAEKLKQNIAPVEEEYDFSARRPSVEETERSTASSEQEPKKKKVKRHHPPPIQQEQSIGEAPLPAPFAQPPQTSQRRDLLTLYATQQKRKKQKKKKKHVPIITPGQKFTPKKK